MLVYIQIKTLKFILE
jgi:hypothetical protein